MSHVDALRMVEHVRTRLVELAVAENHFRDRQISGAAEQVWRGSGELGGLVSELWVEGAFSGEVGSDTLESLTREGFFPQPLCQHIQSQGTFPVDRPLYTHQSEAIRVSYIVGDRRPSLVITAGTGLGKTEAFLLPMLGELWSGPQRQPDGGMRCLILYPMNALVADQVERIYQWLRGQSKVSVFHFTSETPEDSRAANMRGEPEWDTCRVRTRQEARGYETRDGHAITSEPFGQVPDIVITNYSMLEYMLCRPQDRRFFGRDLRCIVLDEAHLYSGSLAAEITMLLRRVRERCCVDADNVLQIATSATLGGSADDLRAFGSDIFSASDERTKLIQGKYARHSFEVAEAPLDNPNVVAELARLADVEFETINSDEHIIEDDEATVAKLSHLVENLVARPVVESALRSSKASAARFLYSTLQASPLVRKLAEVLSEGSGNVLSLEHLSKNLFDGRDGVEERKATIVLLRLAAAARPQASTLPLVPHRLHFLVRAPAGLSACLNQDCRGPEGTRILSIGCLQPYADECRYCGNILLPVHRCDNCGDWALAAHENQDESTLQPGYYADLPTYRTYYLLANRGESRLEEVVIDPSKGEILGHGSTGISLWKAHREDAGAPQLCPTCGSEWTIPVTEALEPEWRHTCRALVGGRPFALSVTAETVLHDLPRLPGQSRHWKPGEGRRLLCFSDSRASAARLGPLLTQQHEIQVVRAMIARCAGELTSAGTSEHLSTDIGRLEEQLQNSSVEAGLRQHLERELVQKREQFEHARAGTPFVDFASLVAQRGEMAQLLDRTQGGLHQARSYAQSDWNRNTNAVRSQAEALVAKELQRPLKRQSSAESVGLVEVVYPGVSNLQLPPLLEEVLSSSARHSLGSVWPGLLTMLLDTVRMDGCVYWSQENPSRKWMDEYLLLGRWLTRNRGGWGARAFVGTTPRQIRRSFIANVLRAAGCSKADSDKLAERTLAEAFDQLFAAAEHTGFSWLKRQEHHQTGPDEEDKAVQILADRLSIRNPTALYWCESTGTVWTSSALGWAPISGCQGSLRSVDVAFLDNNLRWGRARREYKNSSILSMGLWAEEHSAQLSPKETKRLQELFKMGVRNVLSSTTTMELGIDIGGLNGVLLSNVPPGPANHKQRAGRAGRRSDGSAVVITFSRDTEYDRDVFSRFGEFLKRPLRKPVVFLDRTQVIRRHVYAVLLSEYLRTLQPERTGAMHAFGRMGQFCGVNSIPSYWGRSSDPKPTWPEGGVDVASAFSAFLEQVRDTDNGFQRRFQLLAAGTGLSPLLQSENWRVFWDDALLSFQAAISEWQQDINYLRDAWSVIPSTPTGQTGREMAKANSIRYMARTLADITVIEWLANHRFLPRYGFPINLQSLSVRRPVTEGSRSESVADERYRLERSSLLALREYVPESQVLVGGRVATSRGLRKHWTDGNLDQALGLQYFALRCPEDHVYIRQSPDAICPRCGSQPVTRENLIFPRFGYTTAGWEDQPLGTDLERVGEQSVCPTAFAEHGGGVTFEGFANLQRVRVTYRNDAELLVRNAGRNRCGFAVCTRCGFSMSEVETGQGRMALPSEFEKHASIFSVDSRSFCWNKTEESPPVLRNRVLAARDFTDMLLFELPGAEFSAHDAVYSLGRALVMAGARLLELDERELGVELIPLNNTSLGVVVYEVAPGGAGHCHELLNAGEEWLTLTRKVLFVDADHDSRCRKACLDCILDFSGQFAARHLDRRAALILLDDIANA